VATGVAAPDIEDVRRRLREDYEFFIDTAQAAKISPKEGGELVTMRLKRSQRRLVRGLMAQRERGEPQRAQALKARQIGVSTVTQVIAMCRAAQTQNHLAITVSQDRDTTGALFEIGEKVWANLPAEIKPPSAYKGGTKERRYLNMGEPSLQLRRAGVMGLNSAYETATAKRAAAGRGRTIHTLHLSEVAFWDDYAMMLGIVQGVPDLAHSLIVKESTANGNNEFKDEWDDAVAGVSGYIAFFSPWYEEPDYARPFANEADFEEFVAKLGTGRTRREQEAAEEEAELLEQVRGDLERWATDDGEVFAEAVLERRVMEHLHWRRWAIGAKCQGDLDKFHQEYPSTADEAFLSTGRKVFKARDLRAVLKACELSDPATPTIEHPGPSRGLLRGTDRKPVRSRRRVTIDVPRGAVWVPRSKRAEDEVARWRVWHLPQEESLEEYDPAVHEPLGLGQQIIGTQLWTPAGQYLVNVDSASGEEDDGGTVHANHAITVIDHRTLELVAEFESQQDPDDLAEEALLAAMFFNQAWVVVEATGGWGLPVLRKLTMDFHYARVFQRQTVKSRTDGMQDTLGFSTDSITKPLLEARAIELVRDHPHLVKSRVLADQMLSFVRDKRGKTAPETGKLSDVLMSWMMGQYVATIRALRPDRPGGSSRKKQQPRRPRGARD
jgi:hypothetical protein